MSKELVWDAIGERLYETGVRKVAMYPQDASGKYPKGAAWNGVSAITESPSGAESTKLYADDGKYLDLTSAEEYGCTIEAYMYPDEFKPCNGETELLEGVTVGQQERQRFGLCYRTILGNDTEGNKHGYKLHLVYGCKAAPSEKAHNSVSDSPEAEAMSWEITTTPVDVAGHDPSATLELDSTTVSKTKMAAIEKILYGSADTEARLPLPDEVIEILNATEAA